MILNGTGRHAFVVSSSLILSCTAALIGARAQSPQGDGGGGHAVKTAAEQFKNIQVMKEIPADQLIPL